jgi:hypothetical protein
MTLDPRNAIVALFTDKRIPATTEYGTEYVGITLREDNMNATLANDQVGLMLLEQIPNTIITTIAVGGKTVMEMAYILVNLWVVRKKGMKNPDVYMKAILDTFENTIIDHQWDIDTDTRVIQTDSISTIPSDSPELMRRAIMLTAWGYRVRP